MPLTRLEWTTERIAQFWDYQSSRPSAASSYFSAGNGRWIARRAARYLSPSDRESGTIRILDFGCGPGYLLEHLARMPRARFELVGLDHSETSIQQARERLADVPVRWIHATGTSIDIAAGSMDAVFCIEVIEHLADAPLASMLQQAHRILRPGGRLFLTTPHDEDLERSSTCCPNCGSIFHVWQHVRSWTPSMLAAEAARHGFATIHCKPTIFASPPLHFAYLVANAMRKLRRGLPHLFGVFQKPRAP